MYYDINGIKAYDEMLNDKYENRKDTENVFPVGITDAEFRKAIIDIFCGVDWYISYPGSQTQVNEEAIEYILRRMNIKHNEGKVRDTTRKSKCMHTRVINNLIIRDLLDVKWDIIKEADRKAQDLRYTMTYSFIAPTHRLTIYLRRREQRRIKIEFDCQALMLRPPLHGLEEEVNNRIAEALNTRGDK
jgi:hypothetical protein